MYEIWVWSFKDHGFVLDRAFDNFDDAFALAEFHRVSFNRFRVFHNGERFRRLEV